VKQVGHCLICSQSYSSSLDRHGRPRCENFPHLTQSCLEHVGQVAMFFLAFLVETTVSQSGVGHHLASVASCVVYALYLLAKSLVSSGSCIFSMSIWWNLLEHSCYKQVIFIILPCSKFVIMWCIVQFLQN
jgi:hypothetical protein